MKKLEKMAKLKLLKELSDKMSELLMDERSEEDHLSPEGMQKVSVMAPDKESLVEGLSKAEEIVDKDSLMMEDLDSDELDLEDLEDDEDEDELY